eukprot:114789-Pleurochrysis_carterae.AAC.1
MTPTRVPASQSDDSDKKTPDTQPSRAHDKPNPEDASNTNSAVSAAIPPTNARVNGWPSASIALNIVMITAAMILGGQRVLRGAAEPGPPHNCNTYECLAEYLANANLDGSFSARLHERLGWGAALATAVVATVSVLAALLPCYYLARSLVTRTSRAESQAEAMSSSCDS